MAQVKQSSLIGGDLWDSYSDEVGRRMDDPKFRGVLTEEDAKSVDGGRLIVADYGAKSCGDAVRLFWVVDKNDIICKVAFKSFGCGTAVASSDAMAELCLGKTVDEAAKITNIDVEYRLRDNPETPAVPPQKMHCSVLSYDVIRQAVAQYKGIDLSAMEGEEIVCSCAHVTKKTIVDAIRLNDLKTVEEITQYTKAGGYCKSCIRPGGHEEKKVYLVDILKEVREQMAREKARDVEETTPQDLTSSTFFEAYDGEQKETERETLFRKMTLFQKGKIVEAALDKYIRPFLNEDGGGISIVDLEEFDDDRLLLSVRYDGACGGCPSALGGTFDFIQQKLREVCDRNIFVSIL